jgi:hypothetical protein
MKPWVSGAGLITLGRTVLSECCPPILARLGSNVNSASRWRVASGSASLPGRPKLLAQAADPGCRHRRGAFHGVDERHEDRERRPAQEPGLADYVWHPRIMNRGGGCVTRGATDQLPKLTSTEGLEYGALSRRTRVRGRADALGAAQGLRPHPVPVAVMSTAEGREPNA